MDNMTPSIMKVYALSLMAIQKSKLLGDEDIGTVYYGHRGAVCAAVDIADAGLQAKEHVFALFPEEDGWSNHDVVVSPVETSFFAGLQAYIEAGAFTGEHDPAEETRTFHYGNDPTRTHIDLDTSGNVN